MNTFQGHNLKLILIRPFPRLHAKAAPPKGGRAQEFFVDLFFNGCIWPKMAFWKTVACEPHAAHVDKADFVNWTKEIPFPWAGHSHQLPTKTGSPTSGQKHCWYNPQNCSRPDAETAGNLKCDLAFGYLSGAGHRWEAVVWKGRKANQGWELLDKRALAMWPTHCL